MEFISPLPLSHNHRLLIIQSAIIIFLAQLQTTHTLLAQELPANFSSSLVIDGLSEPASFAFSPDGRLFISERVSGMLLVASQDPATENWSINNEPFYTFDVPKNESGLPKARRSAGLRDIAFDPDFADNGYVYRSHHEAAECTPTVARIVG